MRELWANGERYRSYHAFLKAIGVEPGRIRSMQDAVADAVKTGRPIWYGGKSYELSGSKPAPRLAAALPDPIHYFEAGPVEHKPSRLLASGYSTFGLHQDKGDHYAG